MNKTKRFLVVLGAIAIAFAFLWSTIQWYFMTAPQDKANALSSREEIRTYAVEEAERVFSYLKGKVLEGDEGPLDAAYAYVADIATRKYNERLIPLPEAWNARTVLYGYGVKDWSKDKMEAAFRKDIEDFHRERLLELKKLQGKAVKLGLDLSGGISIVLQADFSRYEREMGLREASAATPSPAATETVEPTAGPTIAEGAPADAAGAAATPETATPAESEPVVLLSDSEKQEKMNVAIEILTSRLDTFGLTEPTIRQMGPDQIYVELPGTPDPERINALIMTSGRMGFHIVDDEATSKLVNYLSGNPQGIDDAGVCTDPTIIPAGYKALKVYTKDDYGIDQWTKEWVVVTAEPGIGGEHLLDARTQRGNAGENETHFTFDASGASIFADLTGNNVKKRLAVVVNDRVRITATIQDRIPGGSVRLTGNFTPEEAESYAKILRTASLPIELRVANQSAIGASLGEDKIIEGRNAILLGLILVLLFLFVYYKGAGINAFIAQALNLYFMFSILSVFGLTLTLPSIAGFVLTLGMSVDANVLVFERIKDELKAGKGRQAAIEAGFKKAFWAIMDSNVTTIIAAVLLAQLGSGPVRGFAVSLAIGNLSSLFTSLFVSRLIFDFGSDVLKSQKVSISWRIK
jgi:preprotein translocase subunit SecD